MFSHLFKIGNGNNQWKKPTVAKGKESGDLTVRSQLQASVTSMGLNSNMGDTQIIEHGDGKYTLIHPDYPDSKPSVASAQKVINGRLKEQAKGDPAEMDAKEKLAYEFATTHTIKVTGVKLKPIDDVAAEMDVSFTISKIVKKTDLARDQVRDQVRQYLGG